MYSENYRNSSKTSFDLAKLQSAIAEVLELIYKTKNIFCCQLPRTLIEVAESSKTCSFIFKISL